MGPDYFIPNSVAERGPLRLVKFFSSANSCINQGNKPIFGFYGGSGQIKSGCRNLHAM